MKEVNRKMKNKVKINIKEGRAKKMNLFQKMIIKVIDHQ